MAKFNAFEAPQNTLGMTLQLHDMRHLLITLGLAFLSNRSPERDRTEVTGLFVMTAEADVSARPPHRFQSAPK